MTATTLVTGGAGFIGSHLVARLVDRGERVRVLERPGTSVDHLPLSKIDLIFADIRDRSAVQSSVHGCGTVYHLAANPHLWTLRRGHYSQVNHRGTVHVLEAAMAAGARRILHTSTESILTRTNQHGPITEDQRVDVADALGPYCRSKLRAERFALGLAKQGAPVIVVNPTVPVGPGDRGQSPPTKMILDFCKGKRREYLDGEINLIDVRDVAEGMIRAMERGQPGRRYLLGHENMTIREVFQSLAATTGLPEPTRRVPYGVALAAACVSEMIADLITGQPPVATVTGVRLTRRVMRFDPRASLTALDLNPRPIRQSLADAATWFQQVGWTQKGDRHLF